MNACVRAEKVDGRSGERGKERTPYTVLRGGPSGFTVYRQMLQLSRLIQALPILPPPATPSYVAC
ncbi:hypothetical protein LOAG_05291 [Loa loa]|uniref:Uncharacterized protein n=1 Tax=Loa loa TaxID=7209 RepID=A0A1S0U0M0_LOALO|nr:hypothetical protein LOAG_05291 [Loa loa]EFO23189.1 hypothetical protein LOAG_05291 [Loa loa]